MWRDQEPLLAEKFYEVECGLGGLFQVSATKGWPLCDSLTPEKCNDFPKLTPNQSEIIEIMNPDAQLPGGKIYYKCKQEGFISNIGKYIEIDGEMEHRIEVSIKLVYPRSCGLLK
jgi:hypothetical protein